MSSEERKHEPESRELRQEEVAKGSETVEEAQGSPEDPGSVEDVRAGGEPEPVSGSGDEEPGVEAAAAALSEELEAVRRERDEYLESLRRLKAEFENARKRQERELSRVREMASEKLITELLPVLDNLDRALESEGDIREGVQATREHFVRVLGDEGLAPVASDGQHFDPSVHEAVMSQPSEEHEEGVILQTFERGYLLNGKPIRPAKVVVAHQV